MIIRTSGSLPPKAPITLRDRKVVDARFASTHEASHVELPHLVFVTSKLIARDVAACVHEAHRNAIFAKPPEFFDELVFKFAVP
ncbi:MAG: hypothetical protein NVSMB64_30450 [Candidatus Velthaea sp.]